MEKSIGYSELKVGDRVIPLKCGMFAVGNFFEVFGVDFDTAGELFKNVPKPNSEGETMAVPKNYAKFIAVALWCCANYAARVNNEETVDIMEPYEWIDSLGLYSKEISAFYSEFYFAVLTGKVKEANEEDGSSKKNDPLESQS